MNNLAQLSQRQRFASDFSRALPPAAVLCVVVTAAGAKAELGLWGVLALLMGVAVIPGLIYKRSSSLFARLGLPSHWRTNLVAVLTFAAAVICFLLNLDQPVPATVAALCFGNVGLVFFRRWLNVSAHVSVITFGVLWFSAVFGSSWSWLLVLSPLMLFSRVTAREHSLKEAWAGLALGIATFGCFLGAMTWS
ncbi:hypothetical protein [Arthrobacter sp. MAHUQ-56]